MSPLHAMEVERAPINGPDLESDDMRATFESYYYLILNCIGSHCDTDIIDNNVKILEQKGGQDSEVQFFISFLGEMKDFRDFSLRLVEEARKLPTNETTAFIQILKIFVLEDFEDIKNLENDFCLKYSKERYDSDSEDL